MSFHKFLLISTYITFQLEYCTDHCTETALLKVANELFLTLSKGNKSNLALLVMSSAFGTIDHSVHMHRSHIDFGFIDAALQWSSSYLTYQTQYVFLYPIIVLLLLM